MLRSEELASVEGVRPDLDAAHEPADRKALAESLVSYQRELGAPAAAVAAAASLAEPGAAVIVTGQQPGLLGGPLLTLAKALSAIAWARRLSEEKGVPVVPVFWAASEDHDLEEVNRLVLLNAEDRRVELRLPFSPDGRMVGAIDPGEEGRLLLDRAREALPNTEFRDEVMDVLEAARAPSLGRWFAGILTRWLGPQGLVLAEPDLFRDAAAPLLALTRDRPGAIAAAVSRDGPLRPAGIPFFSIEAGGRRVRVRSPEELPAEPRAVSFDVVSRVLAQNLALPVAGHVVGPAERVYCAQIAPAHELLGIPAPPLLPRARLLLVEGKVEKALAGFEAAPADVLERGADALASRTEARPEEFDRALSALELVLASALEGVQAEADRVDEVLSKKAAGTEKELLRAVHRLRDHARKAMDRVEGRDEERRRKVLAHLVPGGKPQERTLSPLPFLARHGMSLIGKLLKVVERWPDGHRQVCLSRQTEGRS